jgi:hypothetical protein
VLKRLEQPGFKHEHFVPAGTSNRLLQSLPVDSNGSCSTRSAKAPSPPQLITETIRQVRLQSEKSIQQLNEDRSSLMTIELSTSQKAPTPPPASPQPETSIPAPVSPPSTTSLSPVATENRLPGWVYAVGGAGAATIVLLLVLVLRSRGATP